MNIFENIINDYLIYGLSETFDIYQIIFDILVDFNLYHNKEELKNKTMDFVCYVIENNLFELEDDILVIEQIKFERNLSVNEILKKIELLWNQFGGNTYSDWVWILTFKLTAKGINEGKKCLLQKIHIKEKILINSYKKYLNLNSIADFTKEEFNTNDFNIIQQETSDAIYDLIESRFIEAGYKNDYEFLPWDVLRADSRKHIEIELKNLEANINRNLVFICIPPVNALIDKWKECGGRLVNSWYYYIDNR